MVKFYMPDGPTPPNETEAITRRCPTRTNSSSPRPPHMLMTSNGTIYGKREPKKNMGKVKMTSPGVIFQGNPGVGQ